SRSRSPVVVALAGAGFSTARAPPSRASSSARAMLSSGLSSWASTTAAPRRASAWDSTEATSRSALAPAPITMLLRPPASTKMPAVPVRALLAAARRSIPSSAARRRASAAPGSSPNAHRKVVAAPARAAAIAWLKPLPPGPLAYSPASVAPGAGSSAQRHTWSTLNEPTTTTPPRAPISGIVDVRRAMRRHRRTAVVAMLEQRHEHDGHRQRVQGEGHPDAVPVLGAVGGGEPAVDHPAADRAAEDRADAVGHQHEQPLRAGPDPRVALLLDEQRAGDVEVVEGNAVDDAREDDHPQPRARVAVGEQAEAQEPGEHAHRHHRLDPEALQEEGDGEDEQRFRDLRDRHDDRGVAHSERAGVLRVVAELAEE